MNLTELSDLLSSATDVLRVETLNAYSSPSDADYLERFRAGEPKPDPVEKQPWLDRLAAAAERGHPWRRLRVVTRPVSEYVRYSCEWGYVDNVAAGEDARVLDAAIGPDFVRGIKRNEGDLYVADELLILMRYDDAGRFVNAKAEPIDWRPTVGPAAVEHVEAAWRMAAPFTDWWNANADLHRDLSAV